MNPPLRTRDDVLAVIEGLCDGTLVRHCHRSRSAYAGGQGGFFAGAQRGGGAGDLPGGGDHLPGEARLSHSASADGEDVSAACCLLGIPGGSLIPGSPADLVLFDPEETWTVDPDRLHGKSRNTPFKGMTLTGR